MKSAASHPPSCADICTSHLELIAITPEMLRADLARSPEFGRLLDAAIPADWPPEGWDENAYNYLLNEMKKYPDSRGWSRYIATKGEHDQCRILVGGCGLLGPIELTDDPEIGYGLLLAFQHRGYAVEAVAALVDWIFSHPHIRSINAQTFPGHQPSLNVLSRSGFQYAGPGLEEGAILFRKFRSSPL